MFKILFRFFFTLAVFQGDIIIVLALLYIPIMAYAVWADNLFKRYKEQELQLSQTV